LLQALAQNTPRHWFVIHNQCLNWAPIHLAHIYTILACHGSGNSPAGGIQSRTG
jgi:hypothetical protein